MKLWIARDLNNRLYFYKDKPVREKDEFIPDPDKSCYWEELNKKKFPEVTFENSPQQVELKLVNKL